MKKKEPIERVLNPGSSTLYVIFGGIIAGITMPPFEFYRTAKILAANKIFIRDFNQCWYHDGLPGISNDVYSTASFLKKEIQALNPDKVFFVGNSMGGFAAILFAALTGVGDVIAFAPQTFLSPWLRLRYLDYRWQKEILKVYRRSALKHKVWDLRGFLENNRSHNKISIYVSKVDRLDCIHARHIENLTGVTIHVLDSGGHGVVKTLRDKGALPAILSGKNT